MPLFLVEGVVESSVYMGTETNYNRRWRLVEAQDEIAAVEKFTHHFRSMTSEYAIYYDVGEVAAHGIIY